MTIFARQCFARRSCVRLVRATVVCVLLQTLFVAAVPARAVAQDPGAAYAEAERLRARGTGESLTAAIAKYEEAIRGWSGDGAAGSRADAYDKLFLVYQALGDGRKALEAAGSARDAWRAAGDRRGEAVALTHMGEAYQMVGDVPKALDAFDRALPMHREAGNRQGEGDTLSDIGSAYDAAGEKQRAKEYFGRAIEISHALGDVVGEAITLSNIALVDESLGDNRGAIVAYERALGLIRTTNERGIEAIVLNNLAHAYDKERDYGKALETYTASLALIRLVGNKPQEAITLNNLGYLHLLTYELQRAHGYFEEALALSRKYKFRRIEANTLLNLGAMYGMVSEYDLALENYKTALPIFREFKDRGREGASLIQCGRTYGLLGDTESAIAYLQQGLAVFEETGDYRVPYALMAIGEIYRTRGDVDAARRFYDRALPLTERREFEAMHAYLLAALSDLAQRSGDARGSRELAARALAGSRDFNTVGLVASVEWRRGDLLAAHDHFGEALAGIESVRESSSNEEFRASILGGRRGVYESMITLCFEMHAKWPTKGYDAEALYTSERARARSLMEALVETREGIRTGTPAGLLQRAHDVQGRLNGKLAEQIQIMSDRDAAAARRAAVADEIDRLRRDYVSAEADIRDANARYAELVAPKPLSIADVRRRVLDRDTVVVEYFLGERNSYVWVVSQGAVVSAILPPRRQIEERAQEARSLVMARVNGPRNEADDEYRARVAAADAKAPAALVALGAQILGPVARSLTAKRLVVVADGALHLVPFAALAISTSRRDPLIASHEVVMLPSISALDVMRRESARAAAPAKTLAVFADPVFDTKDERVLAAAKLSASSAPSAPSDASLAPSVRGPISFRRLPGTREEANAILSLVKPDARMQALDFDASLATVTGARLRDYRIVHFATHGFVPERNPDLAGILLSTVDAAGRSQEGYLSLPVIYNLDMPADLVVLSGCETGVGKLVRGEGMVGLTRGFMYAGARRVVASLWDVDDRPTAALMESFYREMLVRGRTPAAALREAQLKIRRTTGWSAPYYWAAFGQYGEWR